MYSYLNDNYGDHNYGDHMLAWRGLWFFIA